MQPFLVKDLSPGWFQRKIIVRVTRIWEYMDQPTWQKLFNLNFIIITEGNTMEGCVPSNRIYKFREQLKEGSIYSLESFIVAGLLIIVNGHRSVEYESRANVAYSLIGTARCY